MNYYERHIGDYLKDTAHLSLLEHGVYGRLLDVYYTNDAPIPVAKASRVIGARSPEELEALAVVLDEFFQVAGDVYTHSRCDREIAEFQDGEPDRELKKANERNRNSLHRAERSRLFKILTEAGGHAAWNVGMTDLRALVGTIPPAPKNAPATPPATAPATAPATPATPPATPPATATATPATATHSPLPITQTPVSVSACEQASEQPGPSGPTHTGVEVEQPDTGPRSVGVQTVAQAMRVAGLLDVSATHPKLQALLTAGMSPEELADAAVYAAKKGQGFAYALARAEGRRRDAAELSALPDAPAPASADPDSRASITADAMRLGVGPWRQVDRAGNTVTWAAYAGQVHAARRADRAAAASAGVSP